MSITAVIHTKVQTIDFYDIATQVKEEVVDKELYDGEHCSVEKLLQWVKYSDKNTFVKAHKCKGVCVIDKNTGKQQSFYSSATFDAWKQSVSLSELVDCIIEIHFAGVDGESTEQYYFESTDMSLSSNKRIKLYNFEVLDKDSEKIIPEASFEENNCSRGLEKLKVAIQKGESGLSKDNCIVLLNGIDITEYYSNSPAISMRPLKKEEKGSSHFRYIHRGLDERIKDLKKGRGYVAAIYANDPIARAEILADIDKEIQDLQDQLKATGK